MAALVDVDLTGITFSRVLVDQGALYRFELLDVVEADTVIRVVDSGGSQVSDGYTMSAVRVDSGGLNYVNLFFPSFYLFNSGSGNKTQQTGRGHIATNPDGFVCQWHCQNNNATPELFAGIFGTTDLSAKTPAHAGFEFARAGGAAFSTGRVRVWKIG